MDSQPARFPTTEPSLTPHPYGDTGPVSAPVAASFAIGSTVGGCYQIRRVLGSGGMGTVYEAHDQSLNRSVALKVAHSRSASLRREAQALAAIRHPSMIGVYALGMHEGVEFLVMELVRGRTLYEVLRKQLATGRPFSVAEAVDLLIGIAEGLCAIHASGISHRDIKPANIMLAPGGRTVLMDFGLFKPEFERLDAVAGSPEYMAPEVCMGRVEPGSGHLADLYALGIIAWELLTGEPPFRGSEPMETLRLHVHVPAPRISDERDDLPLELASLVDELIAKTPAERPPTIEDVLGRLRAIKMRGERKRRSDRLSVLIVDDDRELAETVRAVVRDADPSAEVTIAANGEAALASLLKNVPSLLLLDLNMPRMNGLELCMTLRGAGLASQCRIVAMSGSELRARDRQLLEQLDVAAFFAKTPALPRAIVAVVKQVRRQRSDSL